MKTRDLSDGKMWSAVVPHWQPQVEAVVRQDLWEDLISEADVNKTYLLSIRRDIGEDGTATYHAALVEVEQGAHGEWTRVSGGGYRGPLVNIVEHRVAEEGACPDTHGQ